MNKIITSALILACSLVLIGCSVKEPEGTSDPKASAAWINYSLKQANKASSVNQRIAWNLKAYDHAALMKSASHPEYMTKVCSSVISDKYCIVTKYCAQF